MKRTLKVLLAAVLSVAMLFSFASAAEGSKVGVHHEENRLGAFTDAPAEDSWKFRGLNCAVGNGVMNGHENKLRPDDSLTRAEMVAMMVRILGAYANKADIEYYVDVALDAWYYETLRSGVAIKIINGSGNKMMPNDAITREQTFTILARTFLHIESDKGAANRFSDAGSVSDWAKPATNALVESGIVLGDTTNTIRPKADVTRAEFAAMLDRIACYMAKPGGSYTGKTVSGSVILNDSTANLDGVTIEGDLYITDAVGTDIIDLSNVTVTGRVVIRGGEVNIKEGSSASQVVIGNPTNNTTVKADEGVAVDKVVVAENSNNVEIDIPADEVVINSSSSEVTINKDTSNVTVSGSDNTVKVTEGTTIENVTTEGDNTKVEVDSGANVDNVVVNGGSSSVSGDGNVGNATINGSDSTVTTPNTNVTDNSTSSGSDDKTDDGDDDKTDTPSTGGGGTGTLPSTQITVDAAKTYISYGDADEKIYADVTGDTITFDLSGLADEATAIKNIYISTNKAATCASSYFSEVSFAANSEYAVSDLLEDMVNSTSNAFAPLLGIDLEGGESYTIGNLESVVETAYANYSQGGWQQQRFDDYGIECSDWDTASFKGTIGGKAFTVVMIVPVFGE